MSTEQSLNPELIEQTKQQIRSLVNEIAQLSRSDIAPQEFYAEFLTRVVSALAAIGGVVWTLEDEGRLAPQYQINLQQTGLRENEEGQRQHGRLLGRVLTGGEPLLVGPHSGVEGEGEQGANPTDFLLVLGPLKTDVETVGVVEIFQRSEASLNTQKGYLRFLMQMCDLAADFVKSRQLRHFSDRQVLWTQLEDFTRRVHASLDPQLTAYTIANEGRRLIECDRVSVAIRKGRKCRIAAVSGQDLFDKRSNTVRLLGELATKVVDTGDPVWYTGTTTDMAPQVEDAVEQYVDESHTKMVAVLPLGRPQPPEEEQDPDNFEPAEQPVGALIIERIEDSRIPETMLQRVDVVARHSSIALANATEHQDLFLMPLWRTLGRTKWVFRARTLPKTLAISGAVLAVIVAMFVVPWDFTLKCDGTLEPVRRSEIYTRVSGIVKSLAVKHDDMVKEGQLLLELRSTEISVQIRELEGELSSTQERIKAMEWLQTENRGSEEDRNTRAGEIMALQAKEQTLNYQIALEREKEKDLKITSPRDGRVVTWDLENLLAERPVEKGQELMQVADTEGPWQLELHVPEDRMGYFVRAQKEFGEDLLVTFFLATEPGVTHEGNVKEVHYSAEVLGEQGSTVLVKVDIEGSADKSQFADLRPGAEVNAKVHCGRRSVGYILLHDLWAFIESRILFRF